MNLFGIGMKERIDGMHCSHRRPRWMAVAFHAPTIVHLQKLSKPAHSQVQNTFSTPGIWRGGCRLLSVWPSPAFFHFCLRSPWKNSLECISAMEDSYASPTSGEAYRDRRLTTNFELWVEIFCEPTCFHMRIPKPCLSVCLSVCPSVRLSAPREKISS